MNEDEEVIVTPEQIAAAKRLIELGERQEQERIQRANIALHEKLKIIVEGEQYAEFHQVIADAVADLPNTIFATRINSILYNLAELVTDVGRFVVYTPGVPTVFTGPAPIGPAPMGITYNTDVAPVAPVVLGMEGSTDGN